MIHFKKALAIASATLCLNLSVYSQTVTLNVNNVTVKEGMHLFFHPMMSIQKVECQYQ